MLLNFIDFKVVSVNENVWYHKNILAWFSMMEPTCSPHSPYLPPKENHFSFGGGGGYDYTKAEKMINIKRKGSALLS